MVKVYGDIKLYIRVCVKEYVSLNIKNVDKILFQYLKKLHCSMQQRSDFYEFCRLGKLIKQILKVELIFYHNNGKNQKENYIEET